MSKDTIVIEHFIPKEKEGLYYDLPFDVPEDVERIDLSYKYDKFLYSEENGIVSMTSNAIVDLSLTGYDDIYIGSSGSNKDSIYVSGFESSNGYASVPMKGGEWKIVVGAYKIPEDGLNVTYTITYTMKSRRLFKGETHCHTLGSDGAFEAEELVQTGKRMGLNFMFITDHNNYAHNKNKINIDGISVFPGTEWTHYKGHSNMLGIIKPFDGTFYTNTKEETANRLKTAKEKGAMVVLNHPFCPDCGWHFGFDVPFDAVEVWNGIIESHRNSLTLDWWHGELCKGKMIPVTGGSDYHEPELIKYNLAHPTMCVYAKSRELADIVSSIKKGSSYISYKPKGPGVDMDCSGKSMGDIVKKGSSVGFKFFGLSTGDEIKIITDLGEEKITCGNNVVTMNIERNFGDAKFVRTEIVRCYEKGLPPLRAMISNAMYFN